MNTIILPADKGNAIVVMDAAQYEEKMKDLLAGTVYKKVKMATESGSESLVSMPLIIQVLSVHEDLTEFIKLSNNTRFYHGGFVDKTN